MGCASQVSSRPNSAGQARCPPEAWGQLEGMASFSNWLSLHGAAFCNSAVCTNPNLYQGSWLHAGPLPKLTWVNELMMVQRWGLNMIKAAWWPRCPQQSSLDGARSQFKVKLKESHTNCELPQSQESTLLLTSLHDNKTYLIYKSDNNKCLRCHWVGISFTYRWNISEAKFFLFCLRKCRFLKKFNDPTAQRSQL